MSTGIQPPSHLQSVAIESSSSLRLGGFRWVLNSAFRSDQFLKRLSEPHLLVAPPAEPVRKDSKPRLAHVLRLSVPEVPVPLIIKRYRTKGFWHSLKNCFRVSRAQHAFVISYHLAQLQIPTATPVAAGDRRTFRWLRDSFFISTQLENASSLWEHRKLHPVPNPDLFRQLGRIIARLHNAGLSHSDPTVSNFFVQRTADGKARITLIDLDAVRRRTFVSQRRALRELRHFFERIPVANSERLAFIATYCRTRSPRWSSRLLLTQVWNCLPLADGSSRPTHAHMIAGHFRWSIREPELPQDLRPILADPDAFLGPNAHFIKDTRVVTIARAKINRANPVGLVIRRLNYGKFKHRLRDWIRPSRARRAFAHAARFERAAIRTPHALAASERRRLGWPLTAYLITEEVYGAQTLADYLIAHPDPPVRVALQIADLIAQIHLAGFSHRDLKFTNILLTPELCPVIIDLDGVRRGSPRRRTRDFARFDLDLIQYPTVYNKWREPLRNRYAARMRRSGL